jgi:hypothetical protein
LLKAPHFNLTEHSERRLPLLTISESSFPIVVARERGRRVRLAGKIRKDDAPERHFSVHRTRSSGDVVVGSKLKWKIH